MRTTGSPPQASGPEYRSHPLVTIRAVQKDYRNAWEAARGRCHRYVYTSDDDGRPMSCPEPIVASGWVLAEYTGRWHYVDACERHASELVSPPGQKRRLKSPRNV